MEWLTRHAGVAIPIGAAAAYEYLRVLHAEFYTHFGVTPEDVGLGYAQTLDLAGGLLIAVVVLAGVALLWFLAFFVGTTVLVWVIAHTPGLKDLALRRVTNRAVFSASAFAGTVRKEYRAKSKWYFVLAIEIGFLILLLQAPDKEAMWARDGRTIRPFTFPVDNGRLVGSEVSLFGFRAQPATVLWSGEPPSGFNRGPRAARNCLMYLGTGEASVVLYDVANKETLKVPRGEVSLVLLPRLPAGC